MFTIIVFVLVISVLIFVHELGHFLMARKFDIRVDAFSVGFPPRIWQKKIGETEYSIGALPIGGFVKIYGEDGEGGEGASAERSFVNKPKPVQIAVLAAGVIFNIIFAWLCFSAAFLIGVPGSAENAKLIGLDIKNEQSTIVYLAENMPAKKAGLMVGDVVENFADTEALIEVLKNDNPESVRFEIDRKGEKMSFDIAPTAQPEPKFGLSISKVGTIHSPWYLSLWHGALYTGIAIKEVAIGLLSFFGNIFTLKADLQSVSGPVGIATMAGEAGRLGLSSLLAFVAIISVNLAIINIFPLPALDGGRILVALIEWARGKDLPQQLVGFVNTAGIIFLLGLMAVITIGDIIKIGLS